MKRGDITYQTKVPMEYLGAFKEALKEVARLTEAGVVLHPENPPNGWIDVEDSEAFIEKRLGSLQRHAMNVNRDPFSIDRETGMHELAAVAWNAMAILSIAIESCYVAEVATIIDTSDLERYHGSTDE